MRLGLDAVKLNALVGGVKRHAIEMPEEIEMPPGAAKLAVGGELQPDFLLLFDRVADLAVFGRAQRGIGNFVALVLGARLLQRGGPQQAADVIGAERRLGSLHRLPPERFWLSCAA